MSRRLLPQVSGMVQPPARADLVQLQRLPHRTSCAERRESVAASRRSRASIRLTLDQLLLHCYSNSMLEITGTEFVARIVKVELDCSWSDPKQICDNIH